MSAISFKTKQYSVQNTFFLSVLIGAIIIPKVRLSADYVFGLDDFISLFFFMTALLYSLNLKDKYASIVSHYFYTIILLGFISHFLGNWIYSSAFGIPGEMLQYIKRFTFFILSYILTMRVSTYNGIDKITKLIIVVYALALFVGLLQLLGFTEVVELYGRSEKQTRVALRTGNDFKMIGIAGMTTSWGVVCVFFSIVFTSHLVTIKNRYYLPLIILLFTSIVFSFLTVSRSAYICTFFSAILFIKIFLFQKYNPYSGVKKQQFVLKVLKMVFIVVTLFSIVFIVLDNSRIYKILERFDRSTPGVGSQVLEDNGRFIEVASAIYTLNTNPGGYIWGLGRIFSEKNTEHIEVEPFYILSIYGVIGLLLRMFLLYKIYKFSSRILYHAISKNLRLYALVINVSTPMYVIASLGLAFWHEQVTGTPYWIILGMLFALNEIENQTNKKRYISNNLSKRLMYSAGN